MSREVLREPGSQLLETGLYIAIHGLDYVAYGLALDGFVVRVGLAPNHGAALRIVKLQLE